MGTNEKYFSQWTVMYLMSYSTPLNLKAFIASDMQQQLNKPFVLHNRYWATDNDYKQYKFAVESYEALPLEVVTPLSSLYASTITITKTIINIHQSSTIHPSSLSPLSSQSPPSTPHHHQHSNSTFQPSLWDAVLGKAKEWGLIVYEQDWLVTQYTRMNYTQNYVTAASKWLTQMATVAANHQLTIQV